MTKEFYIYRILRHYYILHAAINITCTATLPAIPAGHAAVPLMASHTGHRLMRDIDIYGSAGRRQVFDMCARTDVALPALLPSRREQARERWLMISSIRGIAWRGRPCHVSTESDSASARSASMPAHMVF